MGTMTFNGISTLDAGVIIQTPPVYEFPTKRIDVIQVQGKNGDIVIDKNTYNNVNREYNLASVIGQDGSFIGNVRVLVDWLSSVSGYARLEDSYEPDYFRLAMYRSGGQLPNFYDKATAMIVKFECKPQRFLKSGEELIETMAPFMPITNDIWFNIKNETKYIALPEITITGENITINFISGGKELDNDEDVLTDDEFVEAFGGIIPTLNNYYDSEITISGEILNGKIDCDLQDCYDETGYLNNRTTITEPAKVNGNWGRKSSWNFPKLYPGNNWIRISGTEFTSMAIKPRWWVL